MLRGYVLPSRRAAASSQIAALEAAGVTVIYVEGRDGETFDEALKSLRKGDAMTVARLSDLADTRRELRDRMAAIHAKGCYVRETATGRDSLKDAADMIFDAADVLGQSKKGHDPAKAREFGSRGGRPRMDRGISDAEAEAHWFDMRHATNIEALKHMGKWTEDAAWRKWGASGRKTGPRRSTAKPKK